MNAHPRVAARRLAVGEDLARRAVQRLLKLGIGLGVVSGLVGLAYSPLLSVREVVVVGAVRADVAGALAAGGIQDGIPLIRLQPDLAERWLAADPWVVSVTVRRRFPSRVEVSVEERREVAGVQISEGWAIISNDGRVMRVTIDPPTGLGRVLDWKHPLPTGSQVPEDLEGPVRLLASLTPQLASQLDLAFESEELIGGLGGARIRFGGSQQIEAKAKSLAALASAGVLVPGATVDLLAPERPAVDPQDQVDG